LFHVAVAQLQRVKRDEHGAIRGIEIAYADDWFQLQRAEQFSDLLVSTERNFLAEVHHERLIARGLESRGAGRGGVHFVGII
jgi:hypothetical protein